jgi:hypothetical protein
MVDELHEVGCSNCGKGGLSWTFYTDGKGNFQAKHACGHVSNFQVKDKPEPSQQEYDMRFFY